jgi:hypothetical protein
MGRRLHLSILILLLLGIGGGIWMSIERSTRERDACWQAVREECAEDCLISFEDRLQEDPSLREQLDELRREFVDDDTDLDASIKAGYALGQMADPKTRACIADCSDWLGRDRGCGS